MSNIEYNVLQKLILKHYDINDEDNSPIYFGKPEYAPNENLINKAEQYLNIKFPPSYRWFLSNYAEGEICGDELFIVCNSKPEDGNLSDIVYHDIWNKKRGFSQKNEIALLRTDFGEDFIWRTDEADENGEFPVYLQLGDHREYYAPNYIAFLIKYIKSCLEQD